LRIKTGPDETAVSGDPGKVEQATFYLFGKTEYYIQVEILIVVNIGLNKIEIS